MAEPAPAIEQERRDLEAALRERTAQLERANAELEARNIELKQFAYVASHDLQAPLRHIVGFAEFLEADHAERLDEEGREFLAHILAGGRRLRDLVRDLLSYSRQDVRALRHGPVDLEAAMAEVVEFLVGTPAATGTDEPRIDWDRLPTVPGDRTQLGQVLQNLLENAIKFRHPERRPEIHVSAERSDEGWEIRVRDNGLGIEPAHRERVFKMFRRLHAPTAYPGTGIGLALCRRVVERHGGRIWVDSASGEGSEFRFTLPDEDAAHEHD